MAREALDDVIRVLRDVASDENMRVAFEASDRGRAIARGASVLGVLLLGPPGLVIGGAVGGLVATSTSYKSVAKVILEMPPHKKERLAERARNIMTRNNIQNLVALAVIAIGGSGAVRGEIIQELQLFMTDELQMALA